MGELFRRYWIPALLAEEIAENDSDPVRLTLLGERLIAFRDTDGRIGVIDEFCAHRTASLYFGRNEECGLRCAYHGWKFDVTGQCVDMPSEPEGSKMREKIKLTSYKAVEKGGLVWVYMGPAEKEPELPDLEWMNLPPERRFISKRRQFTNYLQAMEGGIDSSHVSFAHRFNLDDDPLHAGTEGNQYLKADTRPKFEVAESDGGLLIGARRNADEDNYYWRITQWIMPWYTIIPPFGQHNPMGGHAWVPIDDETCWAWSWNYHPTQDFGEREISALESGDGIHVKYKPGTYDPLASAENDYLMDRGAQRRKETFSGIAGIAAQDFSLQESMGVTADRTKERLGTSDAAIIIARRRLMAALEERESDSLPGLNPEHTRVRSTSILLRKEVPFREGSESVTVVKEGEDFHSI